MQALCLRNGCMNLSYVVLQCVFVLKFASALFALLVFVLFDVDFADMLFRPFERDKQLRAVVALEAGGFNDCRLFEDLYGVYFDL